MFRRPILYAFLALVFSLPNLSCRQVRTVPVVGSRSITLKQVELGLASYRAAVLRMDSRAISEQFAIDAEVSHGSGKPVVGRTAILQFLNSFASFKVLSYEIMADQVVLASTEATQSGHYTQAVLSPDSQMITVKGKFTAIWRKASDGQLRIYRMHTESIL